jgi:hypothetical protein
VELYIIAFYAGLIILFSGVSYIKLFIRIIKGVDSELTKRQNDAIMFAMKIKRAKGFRDGYKNDII